VDVALVDAGLLLLAVGLVLLLRPPRRVRGRRRRAGAVVAIGFILMATGLALPVTAPRLPGPLMGLDGVVPVYQFGEHHEIHIAAPPGRVYDAVREVTAREIRFFRLLTWLRSPRLWVSGSESVLNPSPDAPILEVALRSGFVLLRDDPGREIVIGTIVCCRQPAPPVSPEDFLAREGSLTRAVVNFHVVAEAGGTSRLVTQTRVHATDAAAKRRFAVYWRIIYPGSALIRRMWLRAVKGRAEQSPTLATRADTLVLPDHHRSRGLSLPSDPHFADEKGQGCHTEPCEEIANPGIDRCDSLGWHLRHHHPFLGGEMVHPGQHPALIVHGG